MDLLERRTDLRAKRRAMIDTLRRTGVPRAPHSGDRSDTAAPEVRQLRRLESALRRIETGSYGVCMACGGQISAARLHAHPSTALCASCKGEG